MGEVRDIAHSKAQAVLTIDLGALADNWRTLRDRVAPAECAAVVKADAYGIGIEPAVQALSAAGCRTFFVAHLSEGIRARAVSAECIVYVLNGLLDETTGVYGAHALRPVLGSRHEFDLWIASGGGPCALHFDTGMNRLGFDAGSASALAAHATSGSADVRVVMSHFVSSEDENASENDRQIASFDALRGHFTAIPASIANSSALFLPQKPFFDLVRPGYALYGGNPVPGQPNPMKPVVHLQAPIIQLREIGVGETVGYNAQWTARRPTRLATIGVGYADGLPRNLMATDERPGGEAIVAGLRCSFAGRVSMDLAVINVTDLPETALAPGTMVELLGETITIDDMGARAGTIGYEVLTGLGRRYFRKYVGG